MKLQRIELTFVYKDANDKEIQFQGYIDPDSWHQWGASKEVLGENVELIEALQDSTLDTKEFDT